MKITLLIGSLAGGGAERVVCNLANYLADNGHEVTVLTVSDQQTYKINSNVKHVVLYGESNSKLPHKVINLIRLYRMNRYFRKTNVDVYITFLPNKFIIFSIFLNSSIEAISYINFTFFSFKYLAIKSLLLLCIYKQSTFTLFLFLLNVLFIFSYSL